MTKKHFDKGRRLRWDEDLTGEHMDALFEGEVFTRLDETGKPHSLICWHEGTLHEPRLQPLPFKPMPIPLDVQLGTVPQRN